MKSLYDIPIYSITEIDFSKNPLIIIASRLFMDEMIATLQGFNNYILVDTLGVICPSIFQTEYSKVLNSITNNQDEYTKVRAILHDDLSKEVFDSIVNFKMTQKNSFIQHAFYLLKNHSIYFEFKDLVCKEDAVFVDGGGFSGETTEEFISYCPNRKFKKAYYFDPNPNNFNISLKKLAQYSDIEYIQKGLYSESTTLNFSGIGTEGSCILGESFSMDSTIQTDNVIQIQTTTIDEVVKEPATFIKLDIESAELSCLKGAKKKISENTPLLAVCIYHTPDEFFTIPLYLHKNYGDKYNFYLRYYSNGYFDTVLYAVPKHFNG